MRRTYLIPSRAVQALYIVTSSPLSPGVQGAAYSYQMTANGGLAPYTWSLVSQTGTDAFAVSAAGLVTSAATNAETDSLTIKVTDSSGASVQGVFSVTITPALTITTTSPLPGATVGSAYSDTMAASGGTVPYAWSLVSSTGANSWAVSAAGLVTGTPSTAETDSLVIKVTDHAGATAQGTFSLQSSNAAAGFAVESGILTYNAGSGNNYSFIARWDLATQNGDASYYAAKKTHRLSVGTANGLSDIINGSDLSTTAVKGAVLVKVRGLTGAGPYFARVTSIASTGAESAPTADVSFTAAAPPAVYPAGSWNTINSLPATISAGGNYVLGSNLTIPNGNSVGITISTTAAYRLFGNGKSITYANGTDTTQHAIQVTGVSSLGEIYGVTFNQGNVTSNNGHAILFATGYNSGSLHIHDNAWNGYAYSGAQQSCFVAGGPNGNTQNSLATVLSYNNANSLLGGTQGVNDCGGYGNAYNVTVYGDSMFMQHAPQYSSFVTRYAGQNLVAGNCTMTTANATAGDAVPVGGKTLQFSLPFFQSYSDSAASAGNHAGTGQVGAADAYCHDNVCVLGSMTDDSRVFHTDGGFRNIFMWNTVTTNGAVGNGGSLRCFSMRNGATNCVVAYNTMNGQSQGQTIGYRYGSTVATQYPVNGYWFNNAATNCGAYSIEFYEGATGASDWWNNTISNASAGTCVVRDSTSQTTFANFNNNTFTAGGTKVNVTLPAGSAFNVFNSWVAGDNIGSNSFITYNGAYTGYNPVGLTPGAPQNLRAM